MHKNTRPPSLVGAGKGLQKKVFMAIKGKQPHTAIQAHLVARNWVSRAADSTAHPCADDDDVDRQDHFQLY